MKKNFFLLFSMLALSTSVLADGPSVVKNVVVMPGSDDAKAVYMNWTTEEDGSILITITAKNPANGVAVFRASGINKDGFKYNGSPMANYFNLHYRERTNEYRWVPISKSMVQCGATVTFGKDADNKTIEWKIGETEAYTNKSFTYTYGADPDGNTGIGCYSSYPEDQSEYCNATISSVVDRIGPNDASDKGMAYMTWETKANGDVEISLADYENTTNTRFRSSGMAWDKFKLNNNPIDNYFEKVYSGEQTYTLRKKSVEIPAGAHITFNGGTIEWYTSGNTNASTSRYSFDYTYGTSCPSLEAPAISAIDATKHITFSNPEGAESYNLTIYRGANNLVYSQENIHSGDVVNFVPFIDATYSVYVTAVADGLQPATSAAYAWELTASSDPKPLSDICQKTVTDDATKGGPIYLKAETDDDGKIIFTLSGAMSPKWRSGGMQFDQMGVGAAANKLQTYFDKQNQSGVNGYVRTTTLTLTPKANQTGVRLGDRIVYTGNVEWYYTEGTEKESYIGGFTFSYIYGTTCTLALDEEADNTAVIAANDGRTLDARLGRSFEGGENFYSLCLPFGLNAAQLTEVFGDGYELGKMLSASNENGVVTFGMGTASSVEAGKPYIIRPTADAANPLFRGVTIDADASTSVSFGLAGMRGFYAPSVAGEDEWFLGAANTLYQNSDNSASKAFRAFFQVSGGSPLNAPRIRMLPQTATGMETVENGPAQEVRKVLRDGEVYILRNGAAYTVFGQRVY